MIRHHDPRAPLTDIGLLQAMDALRIKWCRPGATFTGAVSCQPDAVVQVFQLDGRTYEVTVCAEWTVSVVELDGPLRRPVTIPHGLTLPKDFRRS